MTIPYSPAAVQALCFAVEDAINAHARTTPGGGVHPIALLVTLAEVAAHSIAQCQEMAGEDRAGPDADGVLVLATEFFLAHFFKALSQRSGSTVRCGADDASAPAGQRPH